MPNFDFNLFDEMLDNAPTAGFGPTSNFGLMKMKIEVTHWDGDSRKFITTAYDGISKLKEGEYFQITFTSDMSEFNPALTREYKRRVDVKKSGHKSNGEKNPKALTDWDETVMPSLKVIGNDWSKKLMKGVYCEWQDVETVVLDKEGNPRSFTTKPEDGSDGKTYVNTCTKFIRVFKSKAECQAAREERFTKKDAVELDVDDQIPANVITDFRGLVNTVGLEKAMSLIDEGGNYPDYNTADIAIAAGFEVPF